VAGRRLGATKRLVDLVLAQQSLGAQGLIDGSDGKAQAFKLKIGAVHVCLLCSEKNAGPPETILRWCNHEGWSGSMSCTSVAGRSWPDATSSCHFPSGVSYSMSSVSPVIRWCCAAASAAALASLCVSNVSEKTSPTLYAHPPSCSTIR